MYSQYGGPQVGAGSMPMYADPQIYGGMPAFTSIPPQQMVQAIPMGAIGFSGAPSQAFTSQRGLMAMAPAPTSSFVPSDPTVLQDRYQLDPMSQYPGADLDVRGAGGGRALYMQQSPQQRGVTPHQHLMSAPPPPAPPLYGAPTAGPMYMTTHPGDTGYPAPPPPPPHSSGPRGKVMHHHYRGMPPAQPHLSPMQSPPLHHQQSQQLAMQHHHQQQPPKRRTQRGMEENIRRTVYVSYIDLQVTEEMLATSFSECGTVVDCRICGDPNSAMRFAFIEFSTIAEAQRAQVKSGMVLGSSPLRVLPSKTAIVPVSRELMPRSNDEVERCSRTVYVANIDKKVDRSDVRSFFEGLCGPVSKLRLLGDYAHSTRISFIEFLYADSAMQALNCSGALLGTLPIRVSPSKTPVRSEASHKDRRGQQQHQQQQQRLLMPPGGQGSSGGGSLHDDDGMYAAEQEQLMAMHLAQTAGTPAEGMQQLEATLAQQQQQQQQAQQQLSTLNAQQAGRPMIMQPPPSPPLVSATDSSAATTVVASDAPSSLVTSQPPPRAFSPPHPPLAQPEEVASSAASFASKYPVIRGRGHHSSPGAAATTATADAPPTAAVVLPAAMVPSGPSAPAAPAAAAVPGGRGEQGRMSAPNMVLQAAVPSTQLAAAPAATVVPSAASSQPAAPTAATTVVLPATAECTADALASQLSQLQVQQQQQQQQPADTLASQLSQLQMQQQQQPAIALTGAACAAPIAAAPPAEPAAPPTTPAVPLTAPAATHTASSAAPPAPAATTPAAAVHTNSLDAITAGLPVPLPFSAAASNLEIPAAATPVATPVAAVAPFAAEKARNDLVPQSAEWVPTMGGTGVGEGLVSTHPSHLALTARAGGPHEERQAAAVPAIVSGPEQVQQPAAAAPAAGTQPATEAELVAVLQQATAAAPAVTTESATAAVAPAVAAPASATGGTELPAAPAAAAATAPAPAGEHPQSEAAPGAPVVQESAAAVPAGATAGANNTAHVLTQGGAPATELPASVADPSSALSGMSHGEPPMQ